MLDIKKFINITIKEYINENKLIKNFQGDKIQAPRKFYRGINPDGGNRLKIGLPIWDSMMFCSDNIETAKSYGPKIIQIDAKPSANIVYEGTAEWRSLVKGIKGANNPGASYKIDVLEEIVKRAKKMNVDAIWFRRQSDYGTGIINKNNFLFSEKEKYNK